MAQDTSTMASASAPPLPSYCCHQHAKGDGRVANGAMFSSGTTVSVVRMNVNAIASISLSRGNDAFDNARHEGEMPHDVVTRAHKEPALFNSFASSTSSS